MHQAPSNPSKNLKDMENKKSNKPRSNKIIFVNPISQAPSNQILNSPHYSSDDSFHQKYLGVLLLNIW